MSVMLSRRALIGGAGAALVLATTPGWARLPGAGPEQVTLQVSPERSTTLFVWAPASPRGVILFSTGQGSWPERYAKLIDVFVSEGFAVLSPLHVDSMRYPDREKYDQRAGFFERFADMRATSAYAASRFADLPIVAAGHSYGSLISLCEGGALSRIAPFRNPAVRAVVAFSTPGKIPGLIYPGAYSSVEVPALIVTGTRDTIPAGMGYESKPTDHLLPLNESPAGAYAATVAGADHALVDDAEKLAIALPPLRLFLRAFGLGDASARRELDAQGAGPGLMWLTRGVQP